MLPRPAPTLCDEHMQLLHLLRDAPNTQHAEGGANAGQLLSFLACGACGRLQLCSTATPASSPMLGTSTCVRCGFVTVLDVVELRQLLPNLPKPRDLVTIISCAQCEQPRCAAHHVDGSDTWKRTLQAELMRGGGRLTTAAAAAVKVLGDPSITWPPPAPGVRPA